MAKTQNQNQQTQPAAAPTLDELREASRLAAEKAAASKLEAEKPDATDEVKAQAKTDDEAAAAASAALTEAEAAEAAAKDQQQNTAQANAQAQLDEAAAAAGQAQSPTEAEAAARAQAEEDAQFVPIFVDEDGEKIPRKTILRLVSTTGQNLRSLDGALITPEPTCELNGFDVRRGDWYTVQFAAGLIKVDSTKKAK